MLARHALYLLGAPGAGKSTLLAAATAHLPASQRDVPFAHVRYAGGVQLGGLRRAFPGTDTLSMSVITQVLPWLAEEGPTVVLGEGDRLATSRFFEALCGLGYQLQIVYLDTPAALAATRRAARGSRQDPAWIAGRVTKHARLADAYTPIRLHLDGRAPVADLAATLRATPALTYLTHRAGVTA